MEPLMARSTSSFPAAKTSSTTEVPITMNALTTAGLDLATTGGADSSAEVPSLQTSSTCLRA